MGPYARQRKFWTQPSREQITCLKVYADVQGRNWEKRASKRLAIRSSRSPAASFAQFARPGLASQIQAT